MSISFGPNVVTSLNHREATGRLPVGDPDEYVRAQRIAKELKSLIGIVLKKIKYFSDIALLANDKKLLRIFFNIENKDVYVVRVVNFDSSGQMVLDFVKQHSYYIEILRYVRFSWDQLKSMYGDSIETLIKNRNHRIFEELESAYDEYVSETLSREFEPNLYIFVIEILKILYNKQIKSMYYLINDKFMDDKFFTTPVFSHSIVYHLEKLESLFHVNNRIFHHEQPVPEEDEDESERRGRPRFEIGDV